MNIAPPAPRHFPLVLLVIASILAPPLAFAQRVDSSSLALQALADSQAPSITLEIEALLPLDEYDVQVFRRTFLDDPTPPSADLSWALMGSASGSGTDFSFTDSAVTKGVEYEYMVRATDPQSSNGIDTVRGFISAAVELDRFDRRGSLVLVVEKAKRDAFPNAINAYKADLVGDGWVVHEITAPTHIPYPMEEFTWTNEDNPAYQLKRSIAETITAAGDDPAEPLAFKKVILLGHVQVPYSGYRSYPDGHNDHRGAWPADGYYGDINNFNGYDDRQWTPNSYPIEERHRNRPGDGKFDEDDHGGLELSVGRVSFHNMPAFDATEDELFLRYLKKVSRYRRGEIRAEARGLAQLDLRGLQPGDGRLGCGTPRIGDVYRPSR